MTSYEEWCSTERSERVGRHTLGVLVSVDDDIGITNVAAHLPSRYAKTDTLARLAQNLGKTQVCEFLRRKIPRTPNARSGDLGEILATSYIEEHYDCVVGPSRLRDRDHQEWAMRGDDVLGAIYDGDSKVSLIKGEAKSRAKLYASVVREARESLDRESGLPSQQSLTQFAERLINTPGLEDVGDAILALDLNTGVRPEDVTHLLFLFAGNDPSGLAKDSLTDYKGVIAQQAVVLRVQAHEDFVRAAFEKAILNGS